ncbi:MAG: hypothetical protein JWQ30_205 [Sediminibacterium sp.]|nr:hypothetical protein [Sediminibacterium sp.]
MKFPNKSTYFTQVEDKYVFRISTAFWHLLIGLLTLASIVGTIMFLWAVIPPAKPDVKAAERPSKPTYPPVKKLNLADLHLTGEKSKLEVRNLDVDTTTPKRKQEVVQIDNDPNKPAYDLALLELRKIIPDNQWKPGEFRIDNQVGWDLTHSDQYRTWVPTGYSIEDYLANIYGSIKANKYSEKKQVLVAITKIAKTAAADGKGKSIEFVASSINANWSDPKMLDSVCTMIATNQRIFNANKSTDAMENIIRFSFSNPNDAFEFIPFSIKICSQISDSLRSFVLSVLTSSYYNYFHQNIAVQKEATDQFASLIPQLKGINPANALQKFYLVYNNDNSQRNDVIAKIMNDYNAQINLIVADSLQQVALNQILYEEAKRKKSDLKWKSLYVVGGGFILIALLGTILTLLSIQRILKKMELGKN